jgi:O-antigen/teichoic acid export membrane protein
MTEDVSEQPNSKTHRVIRGFQWTYVSVALQGALKMAVLVVLARVLTPRDFGLLGFALMCTSFVDRIGQLGLGPALVQAERITPDTIRTAKILTVVCGIIATLVVTLLAPAMAAFFEQPDLKSILIALSLGCLLEAMASTTEALLQRAMRFREMMIADNAAYAFGMAGVGVGLALLGWGVWSLVYATLAMKIVRSAILAHFQTPQPVGTLQVHEACRLLRTGVGFSLSRILNFFSLQGDNFIVGRLLGVEALGMYSRAYQLMTLPAMYVGQVFEKVMFPSMAQSQASRTNLIREFLLTLEAITLIALPAGAAMFILAPEIVLVAFGERWREIIPVVSIVSFGVFFRTAYKCSDTVVRAVGAVYHYAARQAFYTILVTGGAALGASLDGLTGVAIGVVSAVTLNYISMTMLCSRTIGVSYLSIAHAHLSGIWVTVWVSAVLSVSVTISRKMCHYPSAVLSIGVCSAVVAWLLGAGFLVRLVPGGFLQELMRYITVRPIRR